MVVRFFVIVLILLSFSCSTPKNLYGRIIPTSQINSEEDLKIKINGYYFFISEIEGRKVIASILFFPNGKSITTGYHGFEDFPKYEKYLLSEEFLEFLNVNQFNIKNYEVSDDKVITQSIIGGDTFQKHYSTDILKIISPDKLSFIEHYGLKYSKGTRLYRFEEFKNKEFKNRIFNLLKLP